jgi:hypothetical protein
MVVLDVFGAGFGTGAGDVAFGVETGAGAVVLPGVEGTAGVAAGAGDVVAVSTGVEAGSAPWVWSITGADAENPLEISAAKPT